MDNIGLYIHIPFCRRACFYCHFVKQAYDAAPVEKYIAALVTEFKLRANPGYLVDAVYLGGGSPSLLDERQISKIVEAVYGNFSVAEDTEFTIEVNPEDVGSETLKYYKENGINRVSIGVQSFMQGDMDYLERTHNAAQSVTTIENALRAGFTNINVDFIISLPTQTKKSLAENFLILDKYGIPHVSAYILEEVEEGEHKDERDNELYFFTRDYLNRLGYIHYEVSNFSKPGFRARHNLKYWHNESYVGVGLSASGYEKGVDYMNTADLHEYFEKIAKGVLPHIEKLKPADPGLRRIVMGLRLLEGISIDCFGNYRKELEFLLSGGMLIRRDDRIALNPARLLLLNEILTYFVSIS
jgi:oxygen-independent coproporphyrinogen-3 oxidase